MLTATESFIKKYLKSNPPILKPGDTVRIHQIVKEGSKERTQIFEGVVISCRGGIGPSATYKVRKISFGIGVERTFPVHSPRIIKIERIKKSDVRRSKLYFMRGLTGKSARLKNDRSDYAVWEEKGAEEKIEKIEQQIAADAQTKNEQEDDVKIEDNVPTSDEEKAAIAAGSTPQNSDLEESPAEVSHNEAINDNQS